MIRLAVALLLMLLAVPTGHAREGGLSDVQAARLVPPGLSLGPRDTTVPAWPLLREGETAGYLFDTGDLVSIPGFSGTPIDLLVALDSKGEFLDVEILNQNEPVFVDGLGVEPFIEFLKQYRGKSIRQNIKVGSSYGAGEKRTGANVTIDGVSKASASVRIANVTILAASLKVARARMAGLVPPEAAIVREDTGERLDWAGLLKAGYVRHLHLSNADVERAFAGSRFAAEDEVARARPDDRFADLWFAYLHVPTIGVSLLGEAGFRRLKDRLYDGEQAVLVMSSGRWSFTGEDFVRGTVPDRLALRQGSFPVALRDADLEIDLAPGIPVPEEMKIFKIDRQAGFDPGSPWTLAPHVTRSRGMFQPETGSRDFPADYALPARFFERPGDADEPPWLGTWRLLASELGVLGVALAALSAGLAMQRRLTRNGRAFVALRLGFLAFTLGFVGWYAQGQLSIVSVLGLVKAAVGGGDLSFLLYDPVSLLLWVFVLGTLVIWGRGTFCGWLCPFGALQEFSAWIGRRLRLPQIPVPGWLDRGLVLLKYAVLAGLVGGTLWQAALAETLAEVEPFKTAITLGFRRDWPFVLYAAGLVAIGAVSFKPWCRYLCPLGAALALGGRLRLLDWIPRRSACGTPCRFCAVRCRYHAIPRNGQIRYDECFQCLDCVAIYHDDRQCVPLVLKRRATGRAGRENNDTV